ncbi:hypothetical protein CC78DRAFT_585215 [Lojkania enalia]|uniref:Uncharacterized protein n=1 Tax=Lojkania enalia TaxID=147567 RepID=A0A9P4MZA8_9PLEO|nr:hypothetical protein CC78DRAFT_585215 [Didymosphaeria enalia]
MFASIQRSSTETRFTTTTTTDYPTPSGDENSGLNKSDRIALGTSLGIALLALLVGIAAFFVEYRKRNVGSAVESNAIELHRGINRGQTTGAIGHQEVIGSKTIYNIFHR